MGVVGLGQRIVRRIDIEELATVGTTMLRVREMDLPRPPGDEVSDIVQHAREHSVAKAGLLTAGARPLLEIATPSPNPCPGEIVLTRDSFRGVRQVLTGTRHCIALLSPTPWTQYLRDLLACVVVNHPVMMLKTRIKRDFL